MMLNCRELTRMLASDELIEAGWWQRLEGQVHLLMCRHCRRYAAQLRAQGAWAQRSWGAEPEDVERLEQLKSRILHHLYRKEKRAPPHGRGSLNSPR